MRYVSKEPLPVCTIVKVDLMKNSKLNYHLYIRLWHRCNHIQAQHLSWGLHWLAIWLLGLFCLILYHLKTIFIVENCLHKCMRIRDLYQPRTNRFLDVGSCEFLLVCTSDKTDALKYEDKLWITFRLFTMTHQCLFWKFLSNQK